MDEKQFDKNMQHIISSLAEKGYNPVDQINGYLAFRDSSYITRHNNARDIIEALDIEMIRQYMEYKGVKK